jgi:hypothetical protein
MGKRSKRAVQNFMEGIPLEASDMLEERSAGCELHGEIGTSSDEPSLGELGRFFVDSPVVEDHHNAAMVELSYRSNLGTEQLDLSFIPGALGAEDFDSYTDPGRWMESTPNDAHSPLANRFLQDEGAQRNG